MAEGFVPPARRARAADGSQGHAQAGPVRAVVLLSGGLDSSTCLALALRDGREVHTLSFAYGQRHTVELEAAAAVAAHFAIPPERRRVADLGGAVAGSALTGQGDVPLDRTPDAIGADIPATYVPARNLVFLALAVSYAESVEAAEIHLGVNALDYSGYPDCRPEFVAAFAEAARLGTRAGALGRPVGLRTPLVALGKSDIVRLGAELAVPFALTHSCYLGARPACGRCDACLLRLAGFRDAGIRDPLAYARPG